MTFFLKRFRVPLAKPQNCALPYRMCKFGITDLRAPPRFHPWVFFGFSSNQPSMFMVWTNGSQMFPLQFHYPAWFNFLWNVIKKTSDIKTCSSQSRLTSSWSSGVKLYGRLKCSSIHPIYNKKPYQLSICILHDNICASCYYTSSES